jgi:acyl-coenzyme A synthetase/AMP-(fatty) acid ligase
MRFGEEYPAKYDLSTLRVLGSVGEPINPEAWLWFHKNVGREQTPIVDTWWQTETGQFMIATVPHSPPSRVRRAARCRASKRLWSIKKATKSRRAKAAFW